MWLFKEIVNEALGESMPGVLNAGSDRFGGERYSLDLGSTHEAWPIVNVQELRAEFDRIRGGEEATADMVREAVSKGFFNAWITNYSVAQAIGEMDKKSGGDPKYHVNKGIALEYIFGKERDNSSRSDIIGAELKAYAQSAKYVTLFGLAPYEVWHYQAPDAKPVKCGNADMQEVLGNIRKQVAPQEQTKFLSPDQYTDFVANCRSFARVIIKEGEDGVVNTDSFSIFTQFYRYDENGQQVPIDAIESIYSTDASQEALRSRKTGADRKNLYQTVADKIQTIFSFSTVELAIDSGGRILVPGNETSNNVVYTYNKLHIAQTDKLDELMVNFVEGVNNGDIVVSFKITDNLTFLANFMIENSVGAYDKLYRSRGGEILTQNDGEVEKGMVGSEALVPGGKLGEYDNDFSDWTDTEEQQKYQANKKAAWEREAARKKAEKEAKKASDDASAKEVNVDMNDGNKPSEVSF